MPNQFTTSLWGDEAFSAVLSQNSISRIIDVSARDTYPPLYNILEHIWFNFFGSSEIAVRSLSFLFFLLAIFFTYKIGSFLWNKKTGLAAAFLLFLNPFFFIYAFEGRMYSILALGVTASMYFFLKRNWLGYIIATTWALYSHHFAIFAVVVQGIWFLYEFFFGKRKIAIQMFKSFIAIAILYLPWIIPLYNQINRVGGGFWLGTPTLKDLGGLISEFLATGIKHELAIPALYVVYLILITRRWTRSFQKSLFLVSWFLLPILLTWFVSQKFQSIFFNRYLLYTIPGGMLILASNWRKPVSNILIAIVLVLFATIDFNYFTHPTKKPFQDLASFVKETRQEGDFLINWNSSAHHLWETKYYGIPAPIYVPEGDLPFYVGTAQMTDEDILREIPKTAKRLGVITSGPVDEIELPNYTEGEFAPFGDLKFIWYQRNR
ncbi:MAG: glycosyltransferase family 39 protein [Patescibacteria group bacterium]|jgi:mannosyltransferase